MPLTHFECEDKQVRPISQCLDQCPRAEGRCMALAHLIHIGGSQRAWQGQASVTQLLKGSRQAYLEITVDYSLDPDQQAFALYGTLHHRRLEIINKTLEGLAEQKLDGPIKGTLDRLEPDELQLGYFKLIDYKLVGAFAVAKALGLMNGQSEPDMRDWILQLNKYRILLQNDPVLAPVFPISRMFIQATIRDSGLKQMISLKLPRRMPMIPVPKLEDAVVNEFFETKEAALQKALKSKQIPKMCDYKERWRGRRCKGYCPVMP